MPITEAIYIINKDEVLDLYNKSGIIEGIYHDIAGNVIDIDIDNNKVFGGIEINGGTVNVYGDVKIPYMRCKNGTIVANDVTLYADKLDLTNDYESHGKVCFDGNGILKSKKDIDISQIDVMCNGGTLQSDKSIVLHEFRAYGGGVYIANCNLISETGIDAGYGYRDFFNILDNVNVYGNVIGGSLQIVNDVIVDGSFIGSLCVSKDGDITANSFELGDFWNYGGRLYSKGDLLYSGEYRIDDEQSLIIVEGNMRVNGYCSISHNYAYGNMEVLTSVHDDVDVSYSWYTLEYDESIQDYNVEKISDDNSNHCTLNNITKDTYCYCDVSTSYGDEERIYFTIYFSDISIEYNSMNDEAYSLENGKCKFTSKFTYKR